MLSKCKADSETYTALRKSAEAKAGASHINEDVKEAFAGYNYLTH